MTEQDKQRTDYWRKISKVSNVTSINALPELLPIIDRLGKQLTEIKEAGEFIELYVKYLNKKEIGDMCDIILNPGGNEFFVLAKTFRRLAQKLKEVNHV